MDAAMELPSTWLAQFEGARLEEKLGVSAVLATVDSEGWPHMAYLSAGEVLVHGPKQLGLALWPASQTCVNIRRLGQGVLYAAADGAVWEARLQVSLRQSEPAPSLFFAEVLNVRRHVAPYADVMALINFRLIDPSSTIDRWRAQIERLRDSA